jgi:MFS family permease
MKTRQVTTQLWILVAGTLAGSAGQGLVWPFLTIHIREQLDVSLTTITAMFTVQSIAGFTATVLFSPLLDRLGRKLPMISGLVLNALTLLAMSQAATLWDWVILLPVYVTVNTLFRIGSYTMVADLFPAERRAQSYALLRMGANVGIAVGPAVGGFLVTVAYALTYYLAAAIMLILAGMVWALVTETLPLARQETTPDSSAGPGGYGGLIRNHAFMSIWGYYILVQIANAMVFVLLGVYVKENFGITEDRFGFIVGTNALLVVLFQYFVTRATSRYAPLPVVALGALLYAVGMLGFALSTGFAGFLLSMVIMTAGELALVPTATALVSTIAPVAMRARYMGVFSLSFRVGAGIGPVLGGILSDQLAPVAIWYGGMAACLMAAAGYGWLARQRSLHQPLVPVTGSEGGSIAR